MYVTIDQQQDPNVNLIKPLTGKSPLWKFNQQ